MTPFRYPQTRHQRSKTPPHFRAYSNYKPYLQAEFAGQCVYCRLPDYLRGYDTYCVEHYRPQRHFPGLVCAYSNLFYACATCNRRKGDYWPPPDQDHEFIPNPCDHVMFDHVKYVGAEVVSRSQAGKVLVERLDLNDPTSVEYRRFVATNIELTDDTIARHKQLRIQLDKRFKAGKLDSASYDKACADLDAHLVRAQHNRGCLDGSVWARPSARQLAAWPDDLQDHQDDDLGPSAGAS